MSYNASMTLVDIDNTAEPLQLDNFYVIPENEYPYCLFGFQLKNSYDQERIKIKSKYKVKDVIHLLPTSEASPVCFRGIKLQVNAQLLPLIKQLQSLNTSLKSDINVDEYKKLLIKFNLTCNDSYAYLRKGVYPIDGSCINKVSNENWSLEKLYNDAFDNSIPFFQSFSCFTIYIFCNESIYPRFD
jgi:hypothetical protein